MTQEDNRMQFGQDEVPEQEYDDADEHADEREGEPESQGKEPPIEDKDSQDNGENNSDEHEEHPRKSDSAKERINRLTREKYRAAREAQRAKDEIEYWKSKYAEEHEAKKVTTEAGVRQYEANVAARMEKARTNQIAAIESGDAQAQADANVELASATTELHELNNWKSQYEHQKRLHEQEQQYQQQHPFVPPAEYNADIAQDWLQDNEWFHPQSQKHDQELANYIHWVSNNLDQEMVKAGKGNLIRSPEYFEYIDAYRDEFVNHRRNQGQNNAQRRDLNMRVDRGRGPAPVRGAQGVYGGRRGGVDSTGMSREEKEAARWFNISDESYRKGKEEDIRENSHKRGGY